MIEVHPASALRREFAQWASGHSIRTVSPAAFAVGDDLFADIPEPLLAGASIDGQPYQSPAAAA